PLSLAQQRMWFLNRFDPDSAAYNLPMAIRLSGSVDVDLLRIAVAHVVERHESLRTVYPDTPDGPVQVVLPAADAAPDIEIHTVTGGDDALLAAVAPFATGRFDVTTEVPLRIGLFGLGANDYVLAMVVHHISGDGFSIAPMEIGRATCRESVWR